MGRIPDEFLVHTVVVRRYLGSSATGPVFAAAETVRCMVDDKRRMVRDSDGTEVVSESTFYAAPETERIPPESEVDVFGRTTTVITFAQRDGGGLPTPDHVEVTVK